MISLRRLIFRKWNTLFFSLVFILLFTALPYGFYQSWDANLNMAEAVEDIERGSYDILIRPRVSSLGSEATLNIVGDFAANIGEFSFEEEQWEKIELDPEEEEEEFNEVFGDPPVPRRGDGFTIEEWQQFVQDPRIELAAPIATIGFIDSVQQTLALPLPETNGNYRYKISFYTSDGLNHYLLETQYQYLLGSETNSLKEFKIPLTSHLLVAVDPATEQEMTGINLSPLLDSQQVADLEGKPVKILQRNQLTTPLMARIEIEEFELDWEPLEFSDEDALLDLVNLFQDAPIIDETLIEVDLTPGLQPFSGDGIRVQEDGSLVNIQKEQAHVLPESFLILEPVEYRVPEFDVEPSRSYVGNLSISQIANEEIPIFRRRNLMQYIGDPRPPFLMNLIGSFDPYEYSPPTLTAAPLGLYSLSEILTKDGQTFIPTALPGSFMAQAASGITTLEAARQIKGEQFIDAIRLRVADVEVFDIEGRQKIYALANELANQLYDVTIVAGSALSEQILEVEGIGEVSTPWIIIGAVPGMVRDFDILTFTTLTLFTIFMLVWLSSRLKAEHSLLAEESEILAHMGWTDRQLRNHELKSQQVLLVLLNLISMFMLYRFKAPMITYLISFGLLLTAMLVPYLIHSKYKIQIWKKPFQAGEAVHYYWKYYMPIIILLWISFQVISIITASQYRIFFSFNATEIGKSLLNPVNSLMIFLLFLAYMMTVIAVFESISVILRERKDEFVLYQLIGWSPKTIYFYLVKESIQWLFHPLLSAAAIAIIISLLLSFILGGTIVFFILAALILAAIHTVTEKKILWNLTTWNWALLISGLISAIALGCIYSPDLVGATLLISLYTLISISSLILITLYFCFKNFYKSI